MIIFDEYAQGSPEWFKATAGSIGGGTINSVASGGKGKMRLDALRKKSAEFVSKCREESQKIWQYERGLEYEAEARDYFAMVYGVDIRQIAFAKPDNGLFRHYSPDGLFNDDKNFIEIKVRIPKTFVEFFFEQTMPISEMRQVQWGHRIMGTEMCYHVNYCPEISRAGIMSPIIVTEIPPDVEMMGDLEKKAEAFIPELLLLVQKLKRGFK